MNYIIMSQVTPLLKPCFGLYLTQVLKGSPGCYMAGSSLPFQPPSSPPSLSTLLVLPATPYMHRPHGVGEAVAAPFVSKVSVYSHTHSP